jgi:hypothetical protein
MELKGNPAHGRQNGSAKAKALHGPPVTAGSAVHRERLAAEELARRADNAAIKKAQAKAKREAEKVRQEAGRQLAKQIKQVAKRLSKAQ